MAHNDGTPKDLFQAIARSTACSSMVFFGLLAWASLNAHPSSQAQTTTGTQTRPQLLEITRVIQPAKTPVA
jgi:hypothetical protein